MGIDQTGRILIQCAYKEELETLREELILHMKEREQLHSDIRRLCRLASKKREKNQLWKASRGSGGRVLDEWLSSVF